MFIGKDLVIKQNQIHGQDTGSKRVQIFLVQRRILKLEEHLKKYKTDKDAIEAIFKLMTKKKKLLKQIRIYNRVESDSIPQKLEKMRKP